MTSSNDDGSTPLDRVPLRADPDPQGQAALLLVESLIHGLIAKSALTIREAVEIIDIAAAVKLEVAADRGEPVPIMAASLSALNAISSSFRRDIGE